MLVSIYYKPSLFNIYKREFLFLRVSIGDRDMQTDSFWTSYFCYTEEGTGVLLFFLFLSLFFLWFVSALLLVCFRSFWCFCLFCLFCFMSHLPALLLKLISRSLFISTNRPVALQKLSDNGLLLEAVHISCWTPVIKPSPAPRHRGCNLSRIIHGPTYTV